MCSKLKAVECWSILSINAFDWYSSFDTLHLIDTLHWHLDWHLDWHLIQYSIFNTQLTNAQSTLCWHLIISWLIVGCVTTNSYQLIERYLTVQRLLTKILLKCWLNATWGVNGVLIKCRLRVSIDSWHADALHTHDDDPIKLLQLYLAKSIFGCSFFSTSQYLRQTNYQSWTSNCQPMSRLFVGLPETRKISV